MEFGDIQFVDLLPFMLIGFAAQLIDGALGMAFGVISSTLMVGVMGNDLRRGCNDIAELLRSERFI